MTKLQNPVQLGVIGAPHGIKGEVRVKSFTEDPLALGQYGPLTTEDGLTLTVHSIRPAKTVMVARFNEVQDRNAAEALNGKGLFVERDALPDDLDEEEFYHADLIGLQVKDEGGDPLGHIAGVHNFGADDVLEIRRNEGGTVFMPFTRLAVPEIDFDRRIVTVNSEMAGLTDKEEDAQHLEENSGAGKDPQ